MFVCFFCCGFFVCFSVNKEDGEEEKNEVRKGFALGSSHLPTHYALHTYRYVQTSTTMYECLSSRPHIITKRRKSQNTQKKAMLF